MIGTDLTALRLSILASGYRPVPVLRHDATDKGAGKRPTMDGWQNVCATADENEVRRWTGAQKHCPNTGILCGEVIGLDLDVADGALAAQIGALANVMLPATPLLRIGKAPKSLMVFRSEGSHQKISTSALLLPDGTKVQIEALGVGNHFVAFGIHPDTKRPYNWPGQSPLDVPFTDLPVLPSATLHAFLAVAEAAMRAAGGKTEGERKVPAPATVPTKKQHRSADFPPPTRKDVEEALRAVPNTHDWQGWVKIGAAIFDALADDGEDLFLDWSAQSSRNDVAATVAKWKSFHRSPMTTSEATLFYEARKNGWKPERERDARSPVVTSDFDPGEPPDWGNDPGYWQSVQIDAPETEPLDTETPEAPRVFDPWNTLRPVRFPVEAIPSRLRSFVLNRSRIIGGDPCAIAWSCISACSAAIDGRVRLQMKRHDTWSVPPAIWVALIGAPSTKKTPMVDTAWAPLHRIQARDMIQHQREVAEWKALPKEEKARISEPVMRRRLISHDATMEAIQDILSKQDRGIGVLRDELAGWIGSMEKYAGGKGGAADRAFALQSYNGGSHVVDRVMRGTLPINNLLTTICGGIQPDRLRQFGDLTDDGLWQRFVPVIVAPAGMGEDEASENAGAYSEIIDELLAVPAATRLYLCDDAHIIREDVQKRIYALEQSEVLGNRFVGFCGKMVGLWGRLTLVMHLMVEPRSEIVRAETANAARTLLFKSVLPNAARVYAAMGGAGADVEATQSIAGYILTKKLARIVVSDLTSNVRVCRHRSLEDVRKLLSPLEAGGWLMPEKDFAPTSWLVADQVHQRFTSQAEKEVARRAAVRELITAGDDDDA